MLLPFLYETKTILSHIPIRCAVGQAQQKAAFGSYRCLRSIPWDDGSFTGKPTTPKTKPSIRRVDSRRVDSPYAQRYTRGDAEYGSDTQDLDFSGNRQDPEGDIFGADNQEIDYSLGPKRPTNESTITSSEKQAFDQIFASIRARSSKQSASPVISTDRTASVLTTTRAKTPVETLEDILAGAEKAAAAQRSKKEKKPGREGLRLDGQSISGAKTTIQEAVEQYPDVLRAGASKALRATAQRASLNLDDDGTTSEETERSRQEERDRVEKLMRAAGTDLKLWDVMEAEVFTMIARLGLLDEKDNTDTGSEPGFEGTTSMKAKSKKPSTRRLKHTRKDLASADSQLDLEIHGPLYPSYLLLGLRLFDRAFAKPSPLIKQLLPRIKSLGLMSQVLGASTAFYNELISITYSRYDDFPGVLALLQEMDQAGLDLDKDTKIEIDRILTFQKSMALGVVGPSLQSLSTMPGWVSDTGADFKKWQIRAQESIVERENEVKKRLQWSTEAV